MPYTCGMGEAVEELLFDPFRADVRADPYPVYARLREEDPVHWSPFGVWLVSRYDDVASILRDPRFSNDMRNASGNPLLDEERTKELLERRSRVMLFVDPPDHTRLRSLVNRAFTPRILEQLRPSIDALVRALLDETFAEARCELMSGFAYPLPVAVIAGMLGVPLADQATFTGWSRALAANLDPFSGPEVRELAMEAGDAFDAYFRDLIAARRRRPSDDLLGALIAAEEQGDRLSEDELLATCTLLLTAGHETTVNLIGNGTLALLRHPEQLARLRAGPASLAGAIEELLRFDGPVQLSARTALEDVAVGGRTIEAGQVVVLVIGAANRDPARFVAPDRLDVGRTDVRHLAFGSGAHFCLGASLARLEAAIAFEHLVPRLDGAALDALAWRGTLTLRGLSELYLLAV